MIQGILLKGYSGFYYVYAEDRVWECSLRGRFRIREQGFYPGDRVQILPGQGDKATIEKVEPRRNLLVRPAIANVDQALLVFAIASPQPDFNLLDRLLIQVEAAFVNPLIIFTKADRIAEQEESALAQLDTYAKIGYTVLKVSSQTGAGCRQVGEHLAGKVSVLAGPSGVGKSSLLNRLSPGLALKTGQVSAKSQRGRHTTRHVALMPSCGGLVADTPGFSSLDLPPMKRQELALYFPEFADFQNQCRFKSCLHDQEPDCAVKQAVELGDIFLHRYEHYRQFLQEVISSERSY